MNHKLNSSVLASFGLQLIGKTLKSCKHNSPSQELLSMLDPYVTLLKGLFYFILFYIILYYFILFYLFVYFIQL